MPPRKRPRNDFRFYGKKIRFKFFDSGVKVQKFWEIMMRKKMPLNRPLEQINKAISCEGFLTKKKEQKEHLVFVIKSNEELIQELLINN